jgi:Flp pilus assembly protein protease CpaA
MLFYAALTDLRDFQIRNELILASISLWFVYVAVNHQWAQFYWNIAFAVFLLTFMLYFYAKLDGRGRRETRCGRLSLDRH